MALLGKISAVLTANTQDFTRRIGESRRELQDFARQARGVQFNLNTRALDGTLTQLQRFQRTLQEIRQLNARGVDAGLPNANRLRDQFRVFEDIGKPLTQARGQIEGLANSIQGQLYPELGRIQAGFQAIYRSIGDGTTTYAAAEQQINNLRTSLVALGRATAAVGDFDRLSRSLNANNSGGAFFQPRALESLQRSLELRGRAQAVPAAFRSDAFADIAVQAEESAQRVANAAARVARYQLEIAETERSGGTVTSRQLTNRGVAQQRLDQETSRQNAINASFQRELESSAIRQVVAPAAQNQVSTLRERLQGLATELRAIDGRQFNGLIAGAAAVVEQLNRGGASARQARQAVDALAASLNGVNTSNALRQQTESLINTPRDLARRDIQSTFDRQVAGLGAGDPRRRRAEIERDINLRREDFNSETIPRTAALSASSRELGTPQGVRDAQEILQLNRQINAELTRSENLNRNNQYAAAEQSLQRVQALLLQQAAVEGRITDEVEVRTQARRQEELFLEASGGRAEQLSQGARDAAADLSIARQYRGQIRDGAARIEISNEIDRVTALVTDRQRAMAAVANSNLGANDRIRELSRLDNEIRQSTAGLDDFIATRSGGAFSRQQIGTSMERARNESGSLSVRGAATAQLALQQGLFAVDDFMSSTGGLEYKLRAVGNNITQLGLLLGQSGLIPGLSATTGLFVGLATVLGGQALSAILRWSAGEETAEDRTKALSKALSEQNSIVEELARSLSSLGKSLNRGGLSDASRAASGFAASIDAIKESQKRLFSVRLSDLSDNVLRARARISAAERQSEGASTVEESLAARIRARVARRSLEAEERVASGSGNARAMALQALNNSVFQEFRGLFVDTRGADLRRTLNESVRNAGNDDELRTSLVRGRDEAVRQGNFDLAARLERVIGRLDLGLIQAADGFIRSFYAVSRKIAAGLEAANAQVEEAIKAGRPGAVALQLQLERLSDELAGAEQEIRDAEEDFKKDGDVVRRRNRQDTARRTQDFVRVDLFELREKARQEALAAALDKPASIDSRLGRAEQNLQASGAESGILARRLRDLQAQRDQVESVRRQAVADRNDKLAQASQRGIDRINNEIAALEAATLGLKRFSEALARASAEAERNLQAARQREDEVRRQRLAPGVGVALPGAREQEVAERNVREQQALNRRVEEEVAKERDRLERLAQDPNNPLSPTFARLRQIDERLATGGGTEEERRKLIEERRRLQDDVDRRVEESPEVRRARDESTRAEERQNAEARGRALAMTPAQRAAQDAARRAADITAFMNREGKNAQERSKALSQLAVEQAQQVAPMLMGFREERMNALLQGPSRAALNAADVNTMEGQRELNRLLRGDDPNKDVNLVEMQKQSELLQGVIDAIKQQDQGATVEIRG
jgi:hypothetical protein